MTCVDLSLCGGAPAFNPSVIDVCWVKWEHSYMLILDDEATDDKATVAPVFLRAERRPLMLTRWSSVVAWVGPMLLPGQSYGIPVCPGI